MQSDRHVVFLHPSGGIDVDDGINLHRIGEVDFAALQVVGRAGKIGRAIRHVDAAQNRRLGHRSANAQIDTAGQLRVRILKVELRRRKNMHVQPNMAGRRTGVGRHVRRGTGSKFGEVHIGPDDEAGELNVAAQQHVVL